MTALELIATILIVFSVIKLVVVLKSPQAWLNFAKKIYAKPLITTIVALVLAGVVLNCLLNAGFTIVDILAVMVFLMLLMMIPMARYGTQLIAWAEAQDMKLIMKQMWLHMVIWILLLGWGVAEIFF